jgi:VWFA-related protein
MMWRRSLCCLAGTLMIVAAQPQSAARARPEAPAQDPQKPPMFRFATDAVRIEVFVRDRDQRSITGLTATDFEVFDSDVRQDIADIVYGQIPIDVTVALDVSFSVRGRTLADLRRAIGQLMRDLGKEDRLRLILFNSRVSRAMDFTRDVDAVDRAISTATAGGGTTVYDTIAVSLVSASNTDRRQLVMCFTDGEDTNSTTGMEELQVIAQRTRATLAFVLPPPPFLSPGMVLNGPRERLIEMLVTETGGSRIYISSVGLTQTFHRVLDNFRSAYVIHFRPRGVSNGGFHLLRVNVRKPGASVLLRRGYFGG